MPNKYGSPSLLANSRLRKQHPPTTMRRILTRDLEMENIHFPSMYVKIWRRFFNCFHFTHLMQVLCHDVIPKGSSIQHHLHKKIYILSAKQIFQRRSTRLINTWDFHQPSIELVVLISDNQYLHSFVRYSINQQYHFSGILERYICITTLFILVAS